MSITNLDSIGRLLFNGKPLKHMTIESIKKKKKKGDLTRCWVFFFLKKKKESIDGILIT